jgi:hypothetical protein
MTLAVARSILISCSSLSLLRATRHRQASDPRDKVYGLLGIAHVDFDHLLDHGNPTDLPSVNYDATKLEVFFPTVMTCMGGGYGPSMGGGHGAKLDFLRDAGDYQNRARAEAAASDPSLVDTPVTSSASWPSWIPDWSLNVKRFHLGDKRRGTPSDLMRSEATALWAHRVEGQEAHGPCLRVQGIMVLTVCQSFPGMNYKDLEEHLDGTARYPISNLTYSKVLSRLPEIEPVNRYVDMAKEKPQLWKHIDALKSEPRTNDCSSYNRIGFKIEARSTITEHPSTKTMLFLTSAGFVGGGTPFVQPGDEIAVLLGCKAPYIVRRDREQKDHFLLIDECAVYGLMQGQAVGYDRDDSRAEDMYFW